MSHSEDFLKLAAAARQRIDEIQPAEVPDKVGKGALLLDVREREEYEQGHLEGATHLSRGVLEMRIHELAPDKQTPVVVYCAGGNRGALAADTLQQMGYVDVVSICGGLKAFKQDEG